MPDPREALLEALEGLDVKGRVQVILAAVESGLITAEQALPAFAGLWEQPTRVGFAGVMVELHDDGAGDAR